MATAAATKTKLSPNEYDALKALVDAGATSKKVLVADLNLDKKALNALKARDGFLEADTRPQGRGTEVVAAKVLVNLGDYERNANRAARGAGTTRPIQVNKRPWIQPVPAPSKCQEVTAAPAS